MLGVTAAELSDPIGGSILVKASDGRSHACSLVSTRRGRKKKREDLQGASEPGRFLGLNPKTSLTHRLLVKVFWRRGGSIPLATKRETSNRKM